MTQWKKKILNRKNGKRTVTEAKDDDEVKATKVLKFTPATSHKDAKEGKTIRFMHNMSDGTVYWLQGTLEKRMTKYKTAESCKFTRIGSLSKFIRIGSLSVISHWGEQKPLPETVTCNLTPNAAWSLTDDDLALEIEPGDIPGDGNEDEDDVARSQSMKEEEKGASCRTKITPGTYESETDSESLTKIRLANDILEDDASTEVSTISDDANQVRILRTANPSDWLTDEKAIQILHNVQIVINGDTTKSKDDRSNAVNMFRDVISEAQHAMDLAFIAGTITTSTGVARSDAVQYAEKLNDEEAKTAVDDAKTCLKATVDRISNLEQDDYKYLEQWLKKDEKTFLTTKIFFHQARKEMKKSLKLTKVKAANPGGLGAKSKRNKSLTRTYPTLPTTVEETIEPGTSRTEDWVYKRQITNRNANGAAKKEASPKEDANAKPPDYDQSVGWPYQTPQHNS